MTSMKNIMQGQCSLIRVPGVTDECLPQACTRARPLVNISGCLVHPSSSGPTIHRGSQREKWTTPPPWTPAEANPVASCWNNGNYGEKCPNKYWFFSICYSGVMSIMTLPRRHTWSSWILNSKPNVTVFKVSKPMKELSICHLLLPGALLLTSQGYVLTWHWIPRQKNKPTQRSSGGSGTIHHTVCAALWIIRKS